MRRTESSVEDQLVTIRQFIARHANGNDFADDQDLIETGLVNSLFAVQIVMFVENTLGVPVVDGDLDIRNFSSVERISRYVARKRETV
jgi:methoxymalonate biosynthesis acyl carrier protein